MFLELFLKFSKKWPFMTIFDLNEYHSANIHLNIEIMVPIESALNSLQIGVKKNYVKNFRQLYVFSNFLKLIFKNESKFECDF
jgi:hypothetical protein